MPDLPAHVLRLDHAPVARALSAISAANRVRIGEFTPAPSPSRARIVRGLDLCPLCNGSRTCPDCGGPCEVCTVVGGSSYPVIP